MAAVIVEFDLPYALYLDKGRTFRVQLDAKLYEVRFSDKRFLGETRRGFGKATNMELKNDRHSGFSLDAGTRVEAEDRAGLERLLLYVLRPALSLKQLTYKPEADLVRYRPTKGRPDSPAVLEWTGVEFVRRLAALIPPPRKHMVRYYGALGPRSALRRAVGSATRGRATGAELEAGYVVTVLGAVARAARQALRASARSWAACVRRIFEVDPVLCVKCGGEMKLVAIIIDDGELDRVLAHQGWPVSWPKTRPARAPPARAPDADEDSQIDPRGDQWDGRQDFLAGDFSA